MKVISATEVRSNFQDIVDTVHYTKEPMLISKRGRPWVIVQPLTEEDIEHQGVITKDNKRKKNLRKK
jgi:prevent-host-death family protein